MTDSDEEFKTLEPGAQVLVETKDQPKLSQVDIVMQNLTDTFKAANITLDKATEKVNMTKLAYDEAKEEKLNAYEVAIKAQNELYVNNIALLQKRNELLLKELNSLKLSN